MGAFLDGEWESLCNMFTFDWPDFGAQFQGHATNNDFSFDTSSLSKNENECFLYDPTSILAPSRISDIFSDNTSDTTSYNITSPIIPSNSYENCHFSLPNEVFLPMNNNTSMMDQEKHVSFATVFPASLNLDGPNSSQVGSVEDIESENVRTPPLNQLEVLQVKRKCNNAPEMETEHKVKTGLTKKARLSKDRAKNSIESMRIAQDNVGKEKNSDEESKLSKQTSEVNISTSKELISETLKTKKRASRGSATDPQSLYARKRRERINERLRILQNLVPNGTKVDISTMLEEAVQYVKFLQLQIQLLSSDDLWMYAPIAYNGVDISLYKRISPFLLP